MPTLHRGLLAAFLVPLANRVLVLLEMEYGNRKLQGSRLFEQITNVVEQVFRYRLLKHRPVPSPGAAFQRLEYSPPKRLKDVCLTAFGAARAHRDRCNVGQAVGAVHERVACWNKARTKFNTCSPSLRSARDVLCGQFYAALPRDLNQAPGQLRLWANLTAHPIADRPGMNA